MSDVSKPDLTIADYHENPVWIFNEESESYAPVVAMDERVTSIDHFRFRAKFVTAAGDELEGCISGLGDVAISIFANGRWYSANTRWLSASHAQISALIEDIPNLRARSVESFFPLQFRTTINRDPYIDQAGTFSLNRS